MQIHQSNPPEPKPDANFVTDGDGSHSNNFNTRAAEGAAAGFAVWRTIVVDF
jgi:hypothetical protein